MISIRTVCPPPFAGQNTFSPAVVHIGQSDGMRLRKADTVRVVLMILTHDQISLKRDLPAISDLPVPRQAPPVSIQTGNHIVQAVEIGRAEERRVGRECSARESTEQ